MKLALLIVAVLACASMVSATICTDLTAALNNGSSTAAEQYDTVENLVLRAWAGHTPGENDTNTQVVQGLIVNTQTKPFFDGTLDLVRPGTNGTQVPDFTTDAGARGDLVDSLTRFFGVALGCTQGSGDFPNYGGETNMQLLHSNMDISQAVFTAFNKQIVDSAVSFGATEAHAAAVQGFLNGYGRPAATADEAAKEKEICNQDDCNCADSSLIKDDAFQCVVDGDSASTVSVSFVALAAAAVVALFGRQ